MFKVWFVDEKGTVTTDENGFVFEAETYEEAENWIEEHEDEINPYTEEYIITEADELPY